MIQDIFPHKFNNQYMEAEAKANDIAVIIDDRKIYCHISDNVLLLPRIEDIKDLHFERAKYLCAVDDTRFFWIEIESGYGLDTKEYCFHSISDLRFTEPADLKYGVLEAYSFASWYEKNQHCGRCGNAMTHSETERAMRCPDCGNLVYPRINPCVIVGVTDKDRLLLTKYKNRPSVSYYALVAGFAEIGETIEETVLREVKEETGVDVRNLRFYKSQPWAFSDSLLMGFFCDVDHNGVTEPVPDGDELAVAEWVDRENVPDRKEDISLTAEMMRVFHRNMI